MLRMICQRCSWTGVFGDEPCTCGLSYLDFEENWQHLPKNIIVVDEGAATALLPQYDTAWNLT